MTRSLSQTQLKHFGAEASAESGTGGTAAVRYHRESPLSASAGNLGSFATRTAWRNPRNAEHDPAAYQASTRGTTYSFDSPSSAATVSREAG